MKICNKCHRTFNDSDFFCPDCGVALIDQPIEVNNNPSQTPRSNGNTAKEILIESAKKKTEEWDNSGNTLIRWIPSLLSVIGFIVAWEFSTFYGLVLSICGIVFGCTTKNKMNKAISIIVGIICTILCVIDMFL